MEVAPPIFESTASITEFNRISVTTPPSIIAIALELPSGPASISSISRRIPSIELQAAKMANRFKKRFGSFDCKKLTGQDFTSKRHMACCARIVSWSAEAGLGAVKNLKKRKIA